MKHKSLISTFIAAQETGETTLSGSEPARISKSQKSLERLQKYNEGREIEKQRALARLHNRVVNNNDPSPNRPTQFNPSRFDSQLARMNLNFNEFLQTFDFIPPAWRYTREDFKRVWLVSAGASIEEIANITGYSIEPIKRWMKSIIRKDRANDSMKAWIEARYNREPVLSGTSLSLQNDSQKQSRLDKLHASETLQKRIEACTSPVELAELIKEIQQLKEIL